jgi:hypothetical protein
MPVMNRTSHILMIEDEPAIAGVYQDGLWSLACPTLLR